MNTKLIKRLIGNIVFSPGLEYNIVLNIYIIKNYISENRINIKKILIDYIINILEYQCWYLENFSSWEYFLKI